LTGRDLLANPRGRLVLFATLYAAEGAPIGLLWWALPTLLRRRGVPIESITALLATLVLFWTFKFLWAPLVDSLRGRRWGLRAWIATSQAVMAAALLPLAWLDLEASFPLVAALLALHSFAAATQDVAVDALAIRAVEPSRRGALNGWMQAGMLLGRATFGGGALWIEARWGLAAVVAGVVLLLVASLALILFVDERSLPEAARDPASGRSRLQGFARTLREAFARPATWSGLAFALVAAAAFEAAGALAGPLLVDRGVGQETIGLFFGLPAAALMLLGALAGGTLADRGRRRATLAAALLGVVASVLLLAAIDAGGASSPRLLLAPLAAMYLFVGAFTAVSYAAFMDLTDPRLGATQFSTFMAATNGCEAWATAAGGVLAARAGYPAALAALSVVSLAALALIPALAGSGDHSRGLPRAPA